MNGIIYILAWAILPLPVTWLCGGYRKSGVILLYILHRNAQRQFNDHPFNTLETKRSHNTIIAHCCIRKNEHYAFNAGR